MASTLQKVYSINRCKCGSIVKLDLVVITSTLATLHMSCIGCGKKFTDRVPFLTEDQLLRR